MNVIWQPPATTHFRWRLRLAIDVYYNENWVQELSSNHKNSVKLIIITKSHQNSFRWFTNENNYYSTNIVTLVLEKMFFGRSYSLIFSTVEKWCEVWSFFCSLKRDKKSSWIKKRWKWIVVKEHFYYYFTDQGLWKQK